MSFRRFSAFRMRLRRCDKSRSIPESSRVRYLNESGRFNPTGEARDERYYFALFYAPDQGESGRSIFPFGSMTFRVRKSRIWRTMQRSNLTSESRLAILWIKDVWHRLPAYRTQVVQAMDIYDAVLKHNIRTPAGFDQYLAERGEARAFRPAKDFSMAFQPAERR